MVNTLNPIKRLWKPKVPSVVPARAKLDIYGNDLPDQEVHEKSTDSIWATFEALQAAEALRVAKLARE
jgi:hypothetical protein